MHDGIINIEHPVTHAFDGMPMNWAVRSIRKCSVTHVDIFAPQLRFGN
jgi:hypothetical protein